MDGQRGASGLKVPALSFGCGTFGRLDAASATTPPYPYHPSWRRRLRQINPPLV